MADSVQEQIMKKMAGALAEITTSNGYANTIASVQRHNQSGVDLSVVPTVLLKEGECLSEPEKASYPWTNRRMQLFLVVMTRQDETPTSTDLRSGGELLNSLVADVEQRLGASRNWDGLAIDTTAPNYLDVEVDAVTPHLARGLSCEVLYQHIRTNPYSQTP